MKEYVCACSAGCVEDTPILGINKLKKKKNFFLYYIKYY